MHLCRRQIYASTAKGMFVGNTDDNLLDPSNWTAAGTGNYKKMRTFGANIYATGAGFFKIDPATGEASLLATGTPVFLNADNGNTLICGNGTAIHIVDNSENLTTITQKTRSNTCRSPREPTGPAADTRGCDPTARDRRATSRKPEAR